VEWSDDEPVQRQLSKTLELMIVPPRRGLLFDCEDSEYYKEKTLGNVWIQYQQFDLEAILTHLAFSICAFSTAQISMSCLSDAIFAEEFVASVGGHGYQSKSWWSGFCPGKFNKTVPSGTIDIINEREKSSIVAGHDLVQKLWKQREENGCLLEVSCRCNECDGDLDHSFCNSTKCPWTIVLP
jgi:hypothetical protein